MSFDDWTHEGSRSAPQSPPSAPNDPTPASELFLLNPQHLGVLTGDRRTLSTAAPGLGGGCLLLFLLPFILVGLLVPGFAFRSWCRDQQIHANPVSAVARISSHRTSSSDDDDNYYVTYTYRVGREEFSREAEVGERRQQEAVERKGIDVIYSQTRPDLSLVVGEARQSMGFTLLFFTFWDGTIFLVTSAVVGGMLKARRLARHGQVCGGILTQADSHLDSDDDLHVTFHYRFQDPRGLERTGRTSQMRNDWKGRTLPAAGTPCAVLCTDRDDALL